MALLTGQEYRHSLRDGRRVFLSREEVADVTKHPAIEPMVDTMVQVLRDLAGGAAVMVPDQEPLASAELRADVEKYYRIDTTGVEERMRVLHLVRELTASPYGGRAQAYQMFAESLPVVQAMSLYNSFDRAGCKERAMRTLERSA